MTEARERADDYWRGFMAGREEALQEAIKVAHRTQENQMKALEKARKFRALKETQ